MTRRGAVASRGRRGVRIASDGVEGEPREYVMVVEVEMPSHGAGEGLWAAALCSRPPLARCSPRDAHHPTHFSTGRLNPSHPPSFGSLRAVVMSSQPPRPPPPSSSSYPAPTTASTDATTHTNVTSRPTKKRVIRSSRFQSQANAPASSSAQAPPLMPTSASGSGTYESAFSYRTRRRDASAAAAAAPSTGGGSGGERSATPSSSAAAGPSTRSLKKRRVAPPATTAAKTDTKDKGKGRAAAVVVDDDAMETSVPGKIRRRIPTPPKDEYDEPGRKDERLAEFCECKVEIARTCPETFLTNSVALPSGTHQPVRSVTLRR